MNKDSISQYRVSWDKLAKQEAAKNEKLRQKAAKVAIKLKDILLRDYRVKKVVLFGSILQPGMFNERSDIDIAVEGLPKKLYFEAFGRLMFASDFEVDLKPIEDLKGFIIERINKGKVIYEEGTTS